MTSPFVPAHKSEKMFRRYEEHILKIVQNWPSAVWFNPEPFSVTTFKCRLRDSINSLLEYNWTSPIDLERLRQIDTEKEVVDEGGLVGIRPRGSKALPAGGRVEDIVSSNDDFLFEVSSPDDAVIIAVATLIDRKVIQKPIKIKNYPRAKLDQIAANYDVGITDDPRGFFVML